MKIALLALSFTIAALHVGFASLWSWVAHTEAHGGFLAGIVHAEFAAFAVPAIHTWLSIFAHGGPYVEHAARFIIGGS